MNDPSDLVSIDAAASMAERSESTIRRWIRDGYLTRHEAPAPVHGGSAPVLVSTRELLTRLAVSGQQPGPSSEHPNDVPPEVSRVSTAPTMDTPTLAAEVELAVLRVRLAAAEAEGDLRAEVARLRAELDGVRAALAMAEGRATRAEVELVGARVERDDWRARHDAREAELAAMRALAPSPWWRRLLGG